MTIDDVSVLVPHNRQVKSLWGARQAALGIETAPADGPPCDELDQRRDEFYRGVQTVLREVSTLSFGPVRIGPDFRAQRDRRLVAALTAIPRFLCGAGNGHAAEASRGARRLLALLHECGVEPRRRRAALELWARRHAQLLMRPSGRASFEELVLREEEFHQGLDAAVRYFVFDIGKASTGEARGAVRIQQMALECEAFLERGDSPGSGSADGRPFT